MTSKSMSVRINVKGLNLMNAKIVRAVERGLDKSGLSIERDAKIGAPVDTGRLRASISSVRRRLHLKVQDNVSYGIFQEMGTRFMAPHPFMIPSLQKNLHRIKKFISNEIRAVLR